MKNTDTARNLKEIILILEIDWFTVVFCNSINLRTCECCNFFHELCNAFRFEKYELCINKNSNMKKLRTIVTIFFLSLILAGMTSCEVGLRTEGRRHRVSQRHERHENRGKVIIIEKENHRSNDHHDD